jgi:hypothetical protein
LAERGLFGGVFARGGAGTGDRAWLTAMPQTEAALARALERAGLAPAAAAGRPLRAALLGDPGLRGRLDAAGVTPAQVEAALDPAGYRGAAGEFTDAALAAHRAAAG